MKPSFRKLRVRRMALQREILEHQDSASQVRRQATELEFRIRATDERRLACSTVLENHRMTLQSDAVASYRSEMETAANDVDGLQQRKDKLKRTLDHHEKCISSRLESVRRNQKRQLLEQQTHNFRLQRTRDVETVALRHQREKSRD